MKTADHAERSYSRLLVPAIGLAIVCLFGILFVVDRTLYTRLLTAWMLAPFPHPFIDWQFVPAAAECWARGIDVYVATPCYDLVPTMPHPYSPLWLRFSFLPSGPVGVAVLGLGWVVLFWVSQALLPAARSLRELRLTLLVALSSLTAFAIERGNIDLIVFLLAIVGSRLWLGSLPLRLFAYALFLLAGMLKFYPLTLLLLALRERPSVFARVAMVSALILAAAAFDVRGELAAVAHNIPKGSYFTDLFGSVNLPFGLPLLAAYIASKLSGHEELTSSFAWISIPAYFVLLCATVSASVYLAVRAGFREGLTALDGQRKAALLVGAALLGGCFFAGQSVGYRGIFLILLMPGLLELRRTLRPAGARISLLCIYSIVFVAWVLTIEFVSTAIGLTRRYSLDLDGFGLLHWVVHELCWWLIVSVLLTVLLSFTMTSRVGVWAQTVLTRRRIVLEVRQ